VRVTPELLLILKCGGVALLIAFAGSGLLYWHDKRRRLRELAQELYTEPLPDALRRELAEETERAALAKQLGTEPACTAERCTIQNYHSPCLRQTRLAERDYDRPTRYTRGLKAGR
jgi:hypothetical protein